MSRPFPVSIRLLFALLAASTHLLRASPVISEFMAVNTNTLADEDGAFSDWIELHNPDSAPADLTGWSLTDTLSNKAKWKLPAVTLAPGAYLVVFASNKDRNDPAGKLHTNFALSSSGEYLGLIKADETTVAFEYAPAFPKQQADIAYGLPSAVGASTTPTFLSRATPGAANAGASGGIHSATPSFSKTPSTFGTTLSVELMGAGPGQKIRYLVTPPGTAAKAVEPTATSSEYKGPITISSSAIVHAAVFSADDTVKGSTATAYYAKVGQNLSGFSSKLPVVIIDTLASGPLTTDGAEVSSWLYAFPPANGGSPLFAAAPATNSPLTVSVRGSSSVAFPKKSYNVEFTDAAGDDRPVALADLPANEDWALVGPWKYDYNYINNALIYSLSNQMGRWAPRVRFAEVFLNSNAGDVDMSDYAGLYAITDRIEVGAGRVDIKSLSPSDTSASEITGGYILKLDPRDPDEIGWKTSRGVPEDPQISVVLVSPKTDEVVPAQADYIRSYVQQMENALHADRDRGWAQRTYLDYIDRGSWVDHHLLNTFACNPDGLVRSAYFTKDRAGKMRAGPVWDFDRALGSYWDERSFRWNVWSGVGGPDYWGTGWWGVIARDPEFMQEWVDRWQSLRRGALSNASLISQVSSLSAQIGPEAAARDAARWPDNLSNRGSYAAQIEYLKGWTTQRAQWIDEQFLAAPAATSSSAGGTITFTPPAGAILAYTLDGSDPRALGGGIAPNATVLATPLTVPATANVHVRSYRADLIGVFPGSPWSSSLGGEGSSPLSPAARIVNISSRAIVGSGENALIAGVVVADTESKRYLARAIGPGLALFGATGTVPDPQLTILTGAGAELFRNTGWDSGTDAKKMPGYASSVGAFPLTAGTKDSALASALSAGSYTVQISTASNQPGIGLAELYELDGSGRTVNLSTRARVRVGDGVLIGGFVVQGPAYKRMLIRAVGPTLASFGVSDALRDPVLTIYSGTTVVATNDRWEQAANSSAGAAAGTAVGAFALAANSEDAALLITLAPGPYTVEVSGKNKTEGIALLEIYEVP